jgi:hypothetical protein
MAIERASKTVTKSHRLEELVFAPVRIPTDSLSNCFMVDGPIIFNLACQLKELQCQLDELDMATEWPAGGDDLLWRAYGINTVAQKVLARSPGLVQPALAMQVVTLACCLRSLLQQRQAASVKVLCLDRSVSNASSNGTPSACTPMSAIGSVIGTFSACTENKSEKSPLGDFSRQGSALVNTVADRVCLNPEAKPWVPRPKGLNPEAKPWVPRPKGLNPEAKPWVPRPKGLNPEAKPWVPGPALRT